MAELAETKSSRKSAAGSTAYYGAAAAVVALLAVGAIMLTGKPASAKPPTPKPGPGPDPNPQQCPPGQQWNGTMCVPIVVPPPGPGPDPAPQPPPPAGDDLVFDLENNWGVIPMDLRILLAKAELASGIPGVARALAVKAWQAAVAKQPIKTPQEVAAFIAQKPELCRKCQNFKPGEAADSKGRIDANIAAGWPKPKDYDGWIKGSAGLFDMLGSTFVWAGIHTTPGKAYLPFATAASAVATWANLEASTGAAIYVVYRLLYGDLKVLDPGINAEPATQNSENTWGNIFSAYANPTAFKNQTTYAKAAKADYLARAKEVGIDLSKVAYPWPPGKSYKTWTFKVFYQTFLSYKDKSVTNLPAVAPVLPVVAPAIKQVNVNVGPLVGRMLTAATIADDVVAPLIVMLHDGGADETQLHSLALSQYTGARIALLRGNVPVNGKRGWYQPAQLEATAAGVQDAAAQVEAAMSAIINLVPATSAIYVVGFGQGAAVAYRLAAESKVLKVLAISGALPPELRLSGDATTGTQIWATHGTNDAVVPFAQGEATVQSFEGRTPTPVAWRPVQGALHTFASMQAAATASLNELMAAAPFGG